MYNFQYGANDKEDESTQIYQPQAKDNAINRAFKQPSNIGFPNDGEVQRLDIANINSHYLDNINQFNKNHMQDLTQPDLQHNTKQLITKYDNIMDLTSFDRLMIQREYKKLYDKSAAVNEILEERFEAQQIMNLSLRQIYERFIISMTNLVDDLPDVYKNGRLDLSILFKGDRPLYIGILIVVIGISFFFADISS
jgi:DNA gyrase/topoisomerase IV subunit A